MIDNKMISVSTRLYVLSLLIVFSLVFPINVFSGSLPEYLTESQCIELLKGEKQLYLLFRSSGPVDNEGFIMQVHSDLSLKLRLIGIEPKLWEWWNPFLLVEISIVSANNNNVYSGEVTVSFNKESTFTKEKIRGYSKVWSGSVIFANATKEHIRQYIKGTFDDFLNMYLKANPRKFSSE